MIDLWQVEDNDENDSQFIKLGKVVFKHKKSGQLI